MTSALLRLRAALSSATWPQVLLALAVLAGGTAQARDHVLVLAISNYVQQPLRGVRFDADNALRLAAGLGYDTASATVLKDEALTTAGLQRALARLSEGVAMNDRVFVYYSGHGASLREGNQCVQALVGQDGGLVGLGALHTQLEAVKQRTRDALVIIDACHSGGLGDVAVTRSLATAAASSADPSGSDATLQPKTFHTREGEACHDPVNFSRVVTAGRPASGSRAAFPQGNFTFIAAANQREVALDDSERGGLATISLLDCLEQGVADLDGSGQISTSEWLACAQQRVADAVPAFNRKRGTRWTAHTLEGYGNTARALAGIPLRPAPGGGAPALAAASTATTPAATTAPAAGPVALPAGLPGLADATLAAFRQIEANANANWAAGFELPARVKMGTSAPVRYHSAQAGFLTIVYLGSDRRHIDVLAHNVLLQPSAGQLLGQLPITDCPGGCAGDNSFLFLLSQQQIDTAQLLAQAQQGRLPVSAQTLGRLHCAAGSDSAPCRGRQRNAGALQLAPNAPLQGYSAQVVTVTGE